MKKKSVNHFRLCSYVFFSAPVYGGEELYVSGNIGFAIASDSDLTDSTVPGITVNYEFDTG